MPTATMTSKGQTVIPKSVREMLGLHPGDQVDFIIQDAHTVVLKPAATDVRQLKGLLHKPGRKTVSVEDMRAAVARRGSKSA